MHGASQSKRLVVLYALVVHLVFVYATFDVYFQSPLVSGVERASTTIRAPAKRLVVIVADGARADAAFTRDSTPHIQKIARELGRWGVSHARAPTESRPGHVALLGGFYEDPSNIMKGWQANAVEFDHLLNQSTNAWAFGAPSVVPLFSDGIEHVREFMYDETLEDFAAANDHGAVDTWVFDAVCEVLKTPNASEVRALHKDGNVFLLHLLGLDSSGHAHKPHAKEYFDNLKIVDDGVKRIEAAFAEAFDDDGKTAFIFTADHGMSNKGAHGDGDPGCTETPLVVWGAGVSEPVSTISHSCRGSPDTPKEWGVDASTRCDVDQADIAPLGAALLGFPPPRHNSGLLPSTYLSAEPSDLRSSAAIANAEQLLALHELKAERTAKQALNALFSLKLHSDMVSVPQLVATYKRYAENGAHASATNVAGIVSRACLRGLTHLHKYDERLLQFVVVACFASWMILLAVNLLPRRKYDVEVDSPRGPALLCALIYGAIMGAILIVRRAPQTYFLYFGLPAYFAVGIANTLSVAKLEIVSKQGLFATVLGAISAFIVAETICAGFHDRIVFAFAFAFGAILLACFSIVLLVRQEFVNALLAFIAAVSTGIMAPFTTFSVELESNTAMVIAGLLASVLLSSATHFLLRPLDVFQDDRKEKKQRWQPGQLVFLIQTSIACVTSVLVYVVDKYQSDKLAIPKAVHACAWIVALVSPILPVFSPARTLPRMVSVFLGFASPYALFSISYESLFYASLGLCLMSWMALERGLQQPTSVKSKMYARAVAPGDIRHAAVFLFLIDAAFFGTGNIASIASFDLSSVYRLTTRFNPFLMGGLLMLKVLIPMITVAAAFLAMLKLQRVPAFESYLMFLILSDIMAVRFFFQVTTVGSWLDIGSSVSRYALMTTQVVTILPFLALADVYTASLPINGRALKAKRA